AECQHHWQGAHLVSIHSAGENNMMTYYIKRYHRKNGPVWIGLWDLEALGCSPLVFESLEITLPKIIQGLQQEVSPCPLHTSSSDGTLRKLQGHPKVKESWEVVKIILVDVMVSFENRTPAFCEARACKLEKDAPLADTLRVKGYEVQMDTLIVRALGAWDPCNERVLQSCGISRRYAWLMQRLMVSDTIRWSQDIYIEHNTGHRQYQEA
ncbi:hypothetical protein KIL84_020135, partial [Mauremys mutica]